jgi:hypothetical protein
MKRIPRGRVTDTLQSVLRWFFAKANAQTKIVPFYCDPERIGMFATSPEKLAAGDDAALFQVFVTLSMYQALRDVVIMRRQREIGHASMRLVADLDVVRGAIEDHHCSALRIGNAFEHSCDVSKKGASADCGTCPGMSCHVKGATVAFNRMGDMGKLPSSAWFRVWKDGVREVVADVCREERSPTIRAARLVDRFAAVHRVGRKLATMFVSALSTPGLAPGLTPWFPQIDGNALVVVDTNVARAVDALRGPRAVRTYDAREQWIRQKAAQLDLRLFCSEMPRYSPRLVQEALFQFCSKSNRAALMDPCRLRFDPCSQCAPSICPFAAKMEEQGAR